VHHLRRGTCTRPLPRVAVLICLIAAGLPACASRLSSRTVPPRSGPPSQAQTFSLTLESFDQPLSAALVQLAAAPSAVGHRRVAGEYRRLGVLDMAYTHYMKAVEIDRRDAISLDALARIWRDWGFPERGLTEAYHARTLAPDSPVVANTIGTLLQAMGQIRSARAWYMRAVNLDAQAAYALNNVCYVLIMMQQPDAIATCQRAVAASPKSSVARNNLALAFAAAGDIESARQQFAKASGPAAATYNLGILYMALRDYPKAAGQFADAFRADPQFTRAAARAGQARRAAETQAGTR
jgi:tetratricopeptide (TPR) repeat protein